MPKENIYELDKSDTVAFIVKKMGELDITAYRIFKNTTLTNVGVVKIVGGSVKNPHQNSLKAILEYLMKLEFERRGTLTGYEPYFKSEFLTNVFEGSVVENSLYSMSVQAAFSEINSKQAETLKRFDSAYTSAILLRNFFEKGFKSFDALLSIVSFYNHISESRLFDFWNFRNFDADIYETLETVFEKLKHE